MLTEVNLYYVNQLNKFNNKVKILYLLLLQVNKGLVNLYKCINNNVNGVKECN